jgi:pimeloyl-ACP methyl ester carboxylesterase
MQFLLKNLYWKVPGKLAWRFNLDVLYAERANLMAALPDERIDTPSLFLAGGKSHYVPEADRASILRMVPHADFTTMPNSGHWLHADDPTGFIGHCLTYFMS